MLATIRDNTRHVLNMQHITPNSKRWGYSDIPGGNTFIWCLYTRMSWTSLHGVTTLEWVEHHCFQSISHFIFEYWEGTADVDDEIDKIIIAFRPRKV